MQIATKHLKGRLRDESGQTTIFVLCTFFTFFMFFALVANVGQAVNRRVMLQMVADAGAFSGAFSGASAQAVGLNTISEFNQIIDTSWDITQGLMLYFTFQICGVDDVITTIYQVIEGIMSVMIRVTNHASGPWALMEAEMVTRENIADLFPDGSVHSPLESFSSILTGSGSGTHVNNMREAWPALFESLSLVKLEQDSVTKSWICYEPPFEILRQRTEGLQSPLGEGGRGAGHPFLLVGDRGSRGRPGIPQDGGDALRISSSPRHDGGGSGEACGWGRRA